MENPTVEIRWPTSEELFGSEEEEEGEDDEY
jgi:hypothetical protein